MAAQRKVLIRNMTVSATERLRDSPLSSSNLHCRRSDVDFKLFALPWEPDAENDSNDQIRYNLFIQQSPFGIELPLSVKVCLCN
ncbi:hypothetical protein KCP70_05735 [Salmonella enterica subsp. enterica]|nr:hypothetical protein KCP70_05735 [Salmonella enterica subsp. enterica]